jgi:exodeoxyribonuclease V alpha subunit
VEHSRAGGSPGAPERENLAGLVERVTFHNEESGFSVLRVKARGHRDLITVIGHAATIGAGEFVQASGRWVNDRTPGVQFRRRQPCCQSARCSFRGADVEGLGAHVGGR